MKLRVNAATDALAVVLERIAWLTFAIKVCTETTATRTPRAQSISTTSVVVAPPATATFERN